MIYRNATQISLFLTLICILFTSCVSSPLTRRRGESSLSGDWMLASFTQNDITDIAPDGIIITLSLQPIGGQSTTLRGTGFSGVNNYTLSITVNQDNTFSSTNITTTMMAGNDMNTAFENAYLTMLSQVSHYILGVNAGEQTLLLTSSDGSASMKFVRNIFTGVQWKLSTYATTDRGLQQAESRKVPAPYITFGAGGRLTGSTGINRLSAEYRINTADRTLTITQPLTTQLTPPDKQTAETEQYFLEALSQAASYQSRGNSLTFLNSKGHILLTFTSN